MMHATLLAVAALLPAQALVVDGTNSPYAIGTDTTVTSLTVEADGTLTLDAQLEVSEDAVIRGVVTHTRGATGLRLVVTGTLDVQAGGRIDANALGLRGGYQTGNPSGAFGEALHPDTLEIVVGSGAENGGSHAGVGAVGDAASAAPAATWGAQLAPVTPGGGGGGGGCNALGGNGGGVIYASAATVRVDGVISANGQNGANGCGADEGGGGAGGSVWLVADTFSGSGSVTATGGVGGANRANGGGGRILVEHTTRLFTGKLSALSPATGIQSGAGSSLLRASDGSLIAQGGVLVLDETVTVPSLSFGVNGRMRAIGAATVAAPLVVPAGAVLELDDSGALDSLTLDGSVAGTLHVRAPVSWSADVSLTGTLILDERLDVDGDVAITASGRVRHTAGSTRAALASSGTVHVQSGGMIDLDGLGLRSSQSHDPSTLELVTTPPAAGGSHGGAGGYGGVAAYGDARAPATLGGGGGVGPCGEAGGAGGGHISIYAATLRVDGTLRANGAGGVDGCGTGGGDSGGGAGGSLYAQVDVLSGTGVISANGGSGENEVGGGGGGRIAIYYTSQLFSGTLTAAPAGPRPGEWGTVHLEAADGSLRSVGGRLPLADGDSFAALRFGGGGIVELNGAPAIAEVVTIDGGNTLIVNAPDALSGVTLAPSVAGTLVVNAPLDLPTTTVAAAGTLELNDDLDVTGDLVVLSTGRITHAVGIDRFDLDVSGTLDVRPGALIDVSGRGLAGGPNAGFGPQGGAIDSLTGLPTGGAGPETGGSHGGFGAGPNPGALYGDPEAPDFLGAGGGQGPCGESGGRGGGRVRLRAGTIIVGGEIRANGARGVDGCGGGQGDSGGGAGGTVHLTAGTLAGAGLVSADGAAGENEQSGGGGGRVFASFTSSTFTGLMRALGADGGALGSVKARGGSGDDVILAGGTASMGAAESYGSVALGDGVVLELTGAADVEEPIAVPAGATVIVRSSDAFDQLALDEVVVGTLVIDAPVSHPAHLVIAGTLILNERLDAPSVEVVSGGVVTHDEDARSAHLVVEGTLAVRPGGRVDVSGKGLLGAPHAGLGIAGATIDPATSEVVGGSGPTNGGSHLAQGGIGDATQALAPAFDHTGNPRFPGGGGGQGPCGERGGNGGGVMRLTAGTLVQDGVVASNGGNGVDGCGNSAGDSGGGAGGTIVVRTSALSGNGSFLARGGNAENESGGGAGGIIAIDAETSTFTGVIDTSPGGPQLGGDGAFVDELPAVAPLITSTASQRAYLAVAYAYDDDATAEASGDAPLTWSVLSGPDGFGVDPVTGVVSWTPDALGEVSVCIEVSNPVGADTQCFDVTVESAAPPVFTSIPGELAYEGLAYVYDDDNTASASGAQPIQYTLVSGPAGFTIDEDTGAVSWTPADPGDVVVTLRAENAVGSDEQTFPVTVLPTSEGAAPVIVQKANPYAAVGLPYAYDDDGVVHAGGDAPLAWAVVEGPEGFAIDPATGLVTWTPDALGVVDVVVQAKNAFGEDVYEFTVEVVDAPASGPTAVAQITPVEGDAPLEVAVEGGNSVAGPGGEIAFYRWTFGDGSSPLFAAAGSHVYDSPGSYVARLRVTDALGATSESTVVVSVAHDGVRPPSARILVSQVAGDEDVEVSLSCDCRAGDSPRLSYHWSFGDGTSSALPVVSHTFGPGGYEVRLTIVDDNGLTATDSVAVSVAAGDNLPPLVFAWATPPSGAAPLEVDLHSTYADPDGEVTEVSWDFGEGGASSDAAPRYRYDVPGVYTARVTVTDDEGLAASASIEIVVSDAEGGHAPQVLSLPSLTGRAGVSYQYDEDGLPAARGDRPLTWSLGKRVGDTLVGAPEGLRVDASTGALSWTPSAAQAGSVPITLVVENAAGSAVQEWEVEVTGSPGDAPPPPEGCQCDGAGGASPAEVLLLGLMLLASCARRPRASTRRRPAR